MEMGSKLPSEEQLFQVYKLAAESMGANRVVVRIADFGGDKMVESVDLGEPVSYTHLDVYKRQTGTFRQF